MLGACTWLHSHARHRCAANRRNGRPRADGESKSFNHQMPIDLLELHRSKRPPRRFVAPMATCKCQGQYGVGAYSGSRHCLQAMGQSRGSTPRLKCCLRAHCSFALLLMVIWDRLDREEDPLHVGFVDFPRRPARHWGPCPVSGMPMGWGSALIPGGNDAPVRMGIRMPWPHACASFGVLLVVIALALRAMERRRVTAPADDSRRAWRVGSPPATLDERAGLGYGLPCPDSSSSV